ncbi:hypothetical protein TTHT_2026 [Thermotomaculum hydrothermale]|uniref:ABC-2 type transport system permease protein n=1 Tax=Thermotomaculum hydrothermale TaxID=981385 RepID=A0A7R6T087_9BACT|nr:hypothetical protein [Thermotomaculum hydrothermale]BBB33467.1 hypothetical protein TTHT_2026 [Thermotomaculum hydrothermale]
MKRMGFFTLLKKDFAVLKYSVSIYLFFVILSFFAGNSFLTAVDLYSKGSMSALNDNLYSAAFEPVYGVIVPAFGSLFIAFSLILPFAIISLLSGERENNTLYLSYQSGYTFSQTLFSKFLTGFFAVLLSIVLYIPLFVFWLLQGGHLPLSEVLLLISGYTLYGLAIVSISLFSASVFKSISSASIFSFFFVVGSWVIDFLKSQSFSKIVIKLSSFTLSSRLKDFENGIFSLSSLLYFIFLIFLFALLGYLFLRFDLKYRAGLIALVIVVSLFVFMFIGSISFKRDLTESRRNSFQPQIADAVKKLPDVKIKLYFRKTDSRFIDYDENFLERFLMVKPDTEVIFVKGEELEKDYGKFVYSVKTKSGWKSESTYSNSNEEAFIILSKLSGVKIDFNADNSYKGYPLVLKGKNLKIISVLYYFVFPLVFLFMLVFVKFKYFLRR